MKETIKKEIYERVDKDIEKIRTEVHDVDVLVQACKKDIQSLQGRADKHDENYITSHLNFMRVQEKVLGIGKLQPTQQCETFWHPRETHKVDLIGDSSGVSRRVPPRDWVTPSS